MTGSRAYAKTRRTDDSLDLIEREGVRVRSIRNVRRVILPIVALKAGVDPCVPLNAIGMLLTSLSSVLDHTLREDVLASLTWPVAGRRALSSLPL